MRVSALIELEVEAGSPEDAALEFAERVASGLEPNVIVDRGEDDGAEVTVTEGTADGRDIAYHVELRNWRAVVCGIFEHRSFRFDEGGAS